LRTQIVLLAFLGGSSGRLPPIQAATLQSDMCMRSEEMKSDCGFGKSKQDDISVSKRLLHEL